MITCARLCLRCVRSVSATVIVSGVPDVLSAGRTVDELPNVGRNGGDDDRPDTDGGAFGASDAAAGNSFEISELVNGFCLFREA